MPRAAATRQPPATSPPTDVADVLATYPAAVTTKLSALRKLIHKVAKTNPKIGPLTETLKWGQISFLTNQSKAGTTVRIGWSPQQPDVYGLYVHCGTTLVSTYRSLYPELTYQGKRAIVLPLRKPMPKAALCHCIELALTYHLNKKRQ